MKEVHDRMVQVKNVTVDIVRADIATLNVDAIVVPAESAVKSAGVIRAITKTSDGKTDEWVVRRAVADSLAAAEEMKMASVALPALGCAEAGFSLVAAAKITAQEILKFSRFTARSVKRIVVCLPDEKSDEVFRREIPGYIRHIQDDLGQGPYPTVDIIIEMPDGVVVIERTNPPFGLALPGGFVDYGESLEDAARREAKEETNLDLVDLRQMHTFSEPSRDPRFHTVTTVFIARGQGDPCAGDDAKGLKIIPYGDLLAHHYAFDHQEILRLYLAH